MTQIRQADLRDRNIPGVSYGPWAGLAFVVVLVAFLIVVLGEAPTGQTDPVVVRQWFADSGDLWRRFILILTVALLFLFLPFAAVFTEAIQAVAPHRRVWAQLSFTAVVIAVVVGAIADLFWGVLSLGVAETISDEMLGTLLSAYNWAVFVLFQPALSLWGFAAGMAILRSGALPRWQGWLSLGLVIPHLASATWIFGGTFTPFHDAVGAVGTVGHFGIWLPAVAVSMLRRRTVASDALRT